MTAGKPVLLYVSDLIEYNALLESSSKLDEWLYWNAESVFFINRWLDVYVDLLSYFFCRGEQVAFHEAMINTENAVTLVNQGEYDLYRAAHLKSGQAAKHIKFKEE